MELTWRDIGTVRVLSVKGRIDHARAAEFQQALAPYRNACSAQGLALVLDFGGVEYVSSIGLRALMLAAKQVTAQYGCIAGAALSPVVSEVFQRCFRSAGSIWSSMFSRASKPPPPS